MRFCHKDRKTQRERENGYLIVVHHNRHLWVRTVVSDNVATQSPLEENEEVVEVRHVE